MPEEVQHSINPTHAVDETIPQLKQDNRSTLDSFGYHPKAQAKKYSQSFLKLPECRICLEEEKESNHLITPCHCSGSLKFMHALCFDEWVKHKLSSLQLQRQIRKEGGITCEICKQKLTVKFVSKTRCCTKEQIRAKVKQFKQIFWLHIVFMLILLLSFIGGLTAFFYQEDPQNIADRTLLVQIVSGSLMVLAAILLGIGITDFIHKYLLVTSLQVVSNDS